MSAPEMESKPKSWDGTVLRLFLGGMLALTALVLFRSTVGAIAVIAVIYFCRTWQDIKVLFWAGLIAISVRSFAFEPFHIPSGSMKSNLLIGDYLFVAKYKYGYSRYSFPFGIEFFDGRIGPKEEPKRGDVVVFRPPGDTKIDFIKRVIGLPGDTVQVKDSLVYINGVALKREQVDEYEDNEDPRHHKLIPRYRETLPEGKEVAILQEWRRAGENERHLKYANNTPVFKVPEGHYFMMGDNRDNSRDSRFNDEVGFVPLENIVGKAELIMFSVDLTTKPWSLRTERFFKGIE